MISKELDNQVGKTRQLFCDVICAANELNMGAVRALAREEA